MNLKSPPIIVIDRSTVYYGPGLINGVEKIQKGGAEFLKSSFTTLYKLAQESPNVPARILIEERYHLSPVPMSPVSTQP